MKIKLAKGTGYGSTKLSAFDAALSDAGIENYNLIYLSSVIPPDSTVIQHDEKVDSLGGEWGDRLYVVMAQKREDQVAGEAWAGIGWVQDDVTGKGLFVEHTGSSKDEVKTKITLSLEDLLETRGISNMGEIKMQINGAVCEDQPVCAMVIAAYETASWTS